MTLYSSYLLLVCHLLVYRVEPNRSCYYFLVNIKLRTKLCLNTNRLCTKKRIYFYVTKKEVVGRREIGRNTAQHTTHIHSIPHTLYAAPNLNHYTKELIFIFNHCFPHLLHNIVVQKHTCISAYKRKKTHKLI